MKGIFSVGLAIYKEDIKFRWFVYTILSISITMVMVIAWGVMREPAIALLGGLSFAIALACQFRYEKTIRGPAK